MAGAAQGNDGVTAGLQQAVDAVEANLGNAGLVLDVGAIEASCTFDGDSSGRTLLTNGDVTLVIPQVGEFSLTKGFAPEPAPNTEVIAQSDKGFDDAVQNAVAEAAKTIRGIRSVWIDNFKCEVKDDRIVEYRVNAKISFVVEGHR